MLTGKGDERILSSKFERKRRRGMEDSSKIDDDLLDWYQISGNLGGGRTNPDTYTIKQFPFPVDKSIRSAKKIDYRKLPEIG